MKVVKQPYTHVPSEGPLDARIIILGESPWTNEVAAGRPFAGASGHLLKRWWYGIERGFENTNQVPVVNMDYAPDAALDRRKIRLMNLFPYQPPTREISSVPTDKLIAAIEGVHARLARLTDPHVIVPTGNYATFALTGKGKVRADVRNAFTLFEASASDAEKKAGITQLRGSIYPYRDLAGRTVKVIPTIHPAGVLQMMKWERRSIVDWRRIKRESQFREVRDPGRTHITYPSQDQIGDFYMRAASMPSGRMAVDIETWGNTMSCVGFALSPIESITLPTSGQYKYNLEWVRVLCALPIAKVLCGGLYDTYWLDAHGIRLVNYLWDVQSMHHALDPSESHSLDFLASIYCPHYKYWKDEAKEAEEIVKYARDLDSLYVYNGLDCTYTRELVDILEAELHAAGMYNFYFQHYVSMFDSLLSTMRHGIRVDVEAQKKEAKKLRAELKEIHDKLNELAGEELFATETRTALREPNARERFYLVEGMEFDSEKEDWPPKAKFINREMRQRLIKEHSLTYMIGGANAGKIRYKVTKVKKDFSKDKLAKFFYGRGGKSLALPRQFKWSKKTTGKSRSESLGEDALRKLMYKFARAVEPGKLLLQHREKKRELDYLKGAWDKDGRVRCTYKLLTNAGRLSSAKNPMRKGYNLQNIKR